MLDAIAEYRDEMDTVQQFIEECCERGRNYQETHALLYQTYATWMKQRGQVPPSASRFARQLERKGFDAERVTVSGRTTKFRRGIRLSPSLPIALIEPSNLARSN